MSLLELQSRRWHAQRRLSALLKLYEKPDGRSFSAKLLIRRGMQIPIVREGMSSGITLGACFLIGVLFYATMAVKYAEAPQQMGTLVGMCVLVFIFTIQMLPMVRAAVLVAIPTVLTSQIRAVCLILIITWSFQVPAMNLTKNVQLISSTVICVEDKVKTQLADLKENAGEKLKNIPKIVYEKFLKNAFKPFVKIRNILRKFDDTLTRMLAYQRDIMMRISKLLESCNEDSRIPFYRCIETVEKMYYDCIDATQTFLCSPIKLLRSACSTTRILTLRCEWPAYLKKQLDEAVGLVVQKGLRKATELVQQTSFYELYTEKRDAINRTYQDAKQIELNVTHVYESSGVLAINMGVVKQKLRAEVAHLEDFIRTVISILNSATIPIFIWPFLSAFIYVIRFYNSSSYDNYFLSTGLEELDLNRRQKSLPTALPLLPSERKRFIGVTSLRVSKKERPYLLLSLIMSVVSALVPTVIVSIDVLLFKVLDKVNDFFNNNITLTAVPDYYQMKVSGAGFMQELLSHLMEVLRPLHGKARDDLWRECFEEPSPPDFLLFQLMFLLFALAILLCFVQVYAKRFRHVIAERLFPSKVRVRALNLCGRILDNRSNEIQSISGKVTNVESDLGDEKGPAEIYQNCVRCGKTDLKTEIGSNARVCTSCNGFYCVDCFLVREKCMICGNKLSKIDDEMEFYVNSSGSEESAEDEDETKSSGVA